MGYSKKFVEYMKHTIIMFEKENPTIILTNGCDVLCSNCPNNENGVCKDDCTVNNIDRNCIDEYGINFGDTIRWKDLKELAFEKIISQNKICDVCSSCSWNCSKNGDTENTFIKAIK